MEARRNNAIASSIRVKDMQKSLLFYSRLSGFRSAGTPPGGDGKVPCATVGFDSPMLLLSPVYFSRIRLTGEGLAQTHRDAGVEFCIGRSGTGKLDAFFTEVKARGITVVNQSGTEI